MKGKLQSINVFLLDLDGTFYLEDKILPTSMTFINACKEYNKKFVFITNNSSLDKETYITKLAKMGLYCDKEQIMTAGESTALYIKAKNPKAKIYVVGTPFLEKEFTKEGFVLTEDNPDYVVVGFDTTLTYKKLWKLCDLVRAGKPYIATHPDYNCPIAGGYMPDIGGIIAFVEATTGRKPDRIIGKPYEYMLNAVISKLGVDKREVAMVGDRLYTDIAMGSGAHITSILVLTGETQIEDLKYSHVQPDYIFNDLGELSKTFNN